MTNNLWLHCRLYLQKHGRWSAYLKHTQRSLLSGRLCVLVGGCLLVCWLACGVRWSSLWCFTDGCLLASGLSRCGMQPPLYSPIFTLPPLPSVPLPHPLCPRGNQDSRRPNHSHMVTIELLMSDCDRIIERIEILFTGVVVSHSMWNLWWWELRINSTAGHCGVSAATHPPYKNILITRCHI